MTMIYIGIWFGIGALLIRAVTIISTAGIKHGTPKRRSIAMKRDGVIEPTRLMIEAVRETEARSRNELSTSLQAAIAEMRRDTRALDEKVTLMRVEMIRRSDLSEAVQGLLVVLDRQENRFKAMLDKSLVAR